VFRHIEMLERSQKTGWIAGVESGLVDVLCHDGAGPDHDMITNRHRKNGRVSTDANPIADPGGFPLASIGSGGTAFFKKIVDEHDPVADEHLIFDRYTFTYETVRGNLAPSADCRVLLDLDKGPDARCVPDGAAVQVDE